jgi:hypothetical protein
LPRRSPPCAPGSPSTITCASDRPSSSATRTSSPNLTIDYTTPIPAAEKQTLLTLGQPGYRCDITAERIDGKLRLVSQIEKSTLTQDFPDPGPAPQAFRIVYSGGKLETALNGARVLVHPLANLIVAPSQVEVIAGAQVRLLPATR